MYPYQKIITDTIRKRGLNFGLSASGSVLVVRFKYGIYTFRPVFILSKGMIDCYISHPYELQNVSPERAQAIIDRRSDDLPFGEIEMNDKTKQVSFYGEHRIPKVFGDEDRLALEIFINYIFDTIPGYLSTIVSEIKTTQISKRRLTPLPSVNWS